MKFLKILALSATSLLIAQSTALAGSFKFSSPYPEIIFCSGGMKMRQFNVNAKTYSTDYPLQVCLRSKDNNGITPLFSLDRYFTGEDDVQIKRLRFTSSGNPQNAITLVFSMSEKKCVPDEPCFLSAYQTNEFYFTIIKAYFNDAEFARDPIETPMEFCFERFYSEYLKDHPQKYLDAVLQSLEYCNAQTQKDEL